MRDRWVALVNYLINATGSLRALSNSTNVPSSTIQGWANGHLPKSLDKAMSLSKVDFPRINADDIVPYLNGSMSLSDLMGLDYLSKYELPRRRRLEPEGRRKKRGEITRTAIEKSIAMAHELPPIPEQSGQIGPDWLAQMSDTEKLTLLMVLAQSLQKYPIEPKSTHFADWLNDHLKSQSISADAFVRQVVRVMRRFGFTETEASTLANQWISGESMPDDQGLDCLSLVLRDKDNVPIDVSILFQICYPDGDCPSDQVTELCG